jgi:hypothetical protein
MDIEHYIQRYVEIDENKATSVSTEEIYNHYIACGGDKLIGKNKFGSFFGQIIREHNLAVFRSNRGKWNATLLSSPHVITPIDLSPDKELCARKRLSSSSSSPENEKVKQQKLLSTESTKVKKSFYKETSAVISIGNSFVHLCWNNL